MSALIGNMNRTQRRAAKRYLAEENARWPVALKEWPRSDWPNPTLPMLKVFRSRGFLVQVHPAPAPAIVRLSVLRSDLDRDGGWTADIAWEDLQRLKCEAGYGGHDAVEIYPPERDVVNVANIRHLWVLAGGSLPFAWRAEAC